MKNTSTIVIEDSPPSVTITMTTRDIVTRIMEMRMRIQDDVSNIRVMFLIGGSLLGGLEAQTVPSRPTG